MKNWTDVERLVHDEDCTEMEKVPVAENNWTEGQKTFSVDEETLADTKGNSFQTENTVTTEQGEEMESVYPDNFSQGQNS